MANIVDMPKRYMVDERWNVIARCLEVLFGDKYSINIYEKDQRIYIEQKDRINENS